jgi:hypothetical protein
MAEHHSRRERFNHVARRALRTAAGIGRPSLVVASMGRSGSTLLYNAVSDAMTRSSPVGPHMARRVVRDVAWDLGSARLQRGVVYKTHDAAKDSLDGDDVRAIFVFGPASDSALSVISCRDRFGEAWVREHFKHLHADGSTEDLLHRDALGFRRLIESWTIARPYPILLLHYHHLWECQRQISDFIGAPVLLPDQRARRHSHLEASTIQQVRRNFQELDSWISALPRCQIIGPRA